ncbi:MAG: hypothetical protein ABWY51_00360, partial [Gaiellaceae bacterium]
MAPSRSAGTVAAGKRSRRARQNVGCGRRASDRNVRDRKVIGARRAGASRHRVVDTDYGGWTEEAPGTDGRPVEPLWRENRIDALLTEHDDGALFISGTVANQGTFYPRFEAVVLLSAPADVILERV